MADVMDVRAFIESTTKALKDENFGEGEYVILVFTTNTNAFRDVAAVFASLHEFDRNIRRKLKEINETVEGLALVEFSCHVFD